MMDVVVSCDFEKGLLKALGNFACDVKCCHFHMCQSIWRFVAKCGLASRYYTDTSFRVRVRYLMKLPMLPHDKIVAAFHELEEFSRKRTMVSGQCTGTSTTSG